MSEPQKRFPRTPLIFRLRMPKLVRELEMALIAAAPRWEAADRATALEAARALQADAEAQGLRGLAVMTRSLAALMNLPQDQILSISAPFTAKVRELLEMIQAASDRALLETA